ncbi:MAG: undecaprenyl/decaprenyl-phosphate alpha-N-acetylglucosaminyl 1-phosphate transferase [Planctomycetes bacterium]|nr:undecaprenyl/decaprenyl-phosphate alpha-N-acetylglucosaminyl 1-phosphate transferase [Planctomycetota bacterium]
MSPMVWLVLALVVLGFAIAWPVSWLLVVVGGRGHGRDSSGAPGHVKTLREIPNTGGLAIFLAVAGPVAVALAAVWTFQTQTWTQMGLGVVVQHLNQIEGTTPTALAMLAGMAFLHILGLIDDRRSLNPWLKLAVQLAVALVIVWWFDVRLLTMLGTGTSIVLTVLWIVVVTNAINFMDNMDGLAAGVSAIAAGLFMAACIVNEQWFIAATLALLIGSLVAFLLFNFPPAKIFMGDGGSLVIGFLLAILTVRTTYYDPTRDDHALGGGVYGLFMPLVVLAIPLYDVCTVSFIRLKQRRSPLVGDQQHFSHRLVQRGLSQRGAVVVIWSATAVVGIGGIVLGRLEAWQAILVGVQTALVLVMIALLEYASRRASARDGVP